MSENLQATFQFLAKTENKAALDVLIAGLDYPDQAIRSNTIRACWNAGTRQGTARWSGDSRRWTKSAET